MSTPISCPKCDRVLSVNRGKIAKRVGCPCGFEFVIADEETTTESIGFTDETAAERAARRVPAQKSHPTLEKEEDDEEDNADDDSVDLDRVVSASCTSFPVMCPNCGTKKNLSKKVTTYRFTHVVVGFTPENPGKFNRWVNYSYVCELYVCDRCRRLLPKYERKQKLRSRARHVASATAIAGLLGMWKLYAMAYFDGSMMEALAARSSLAFAGLGLVSALGLWIGVVLMFSPFFQMDFRWVHVEAASANQKSIMQSSNTNPKILISFPSKKYMDEFKAHYKAARRSRRKWRS